MAGNELNDLRVALHDLEQHYFLPVLVDELAAFGIADLESRPGALHSCLLHAETVSGFRSMELTKQITWSETRPALYHFRTHEGREVDFVLESRDGRIVGIEVKAASSVEQKDFSGLRYLREVAGKRFHRGVLLYTGEHSLSCERDIALLPVSALWQAGSTDAVNIFKM